MTNSALFWFFSTLFWTVVMSFYSTQEMAAISCNKLRLEYYFSQNKRWARWLSELLEQPTKLFSTTLIGVNAALMASSECARRFYQEVGLNPNLALFTQIPFVLIFGELVPMFAARIHSEHMSRIGIPLLYLSAKILSPIIVVIDLMFKSLNRLIGKKEQKEPASFLNREELQRLIEEHHVGLTPSYEQNPNAIIENIFSLKNKKAFQLMQRLDTILSLSSHTKVSESRAYFGKIDERYLVVYHRHPNKIIGIIRPHHLLQASDNKKIGEFVEPAYFISENTSAFELLHTLREESLVAIVLSKSGEPEGIVTLNDIIDELFRTTKSESFHKTKKLTYLEKTFPGDIKIKDFNEAYNFSIDDQGFETFGALIHHILGRNPAVGDTIFLDPIEIEVKETSLFKAKSILIRSTVS